MELVTKRNIISLIFAFTCLLLFFFFPVDDFKFEIFVALIIFLFVLPVMYTKIILHENYDKLGFGSIKIDVKTVFFIITSIVLGGLVAFGIVTFEIGVQPYLMSLSEAILTHFGAFAIYEIFFASLTLFLFTFFAWGFVYSIKLKKEIYTYIIAELVFIVLLVSFYHSTWIIIPMLIPTLFVPQIRDKKNIIYLFSAIFVIALIIDTLIIKLYS